MSLIRDVVDFLKESYAYLNIQELSVVLKIFSFNLDFFNREAEIIYTNHEEKDIKLGYIREKLGRDCCSSDKYFIESFILKNSNKNYTNIYKVDIDGCRFRIQYNSSSSDNYRRIHEYLTEYEPYDYVMEFESKIFHDIENLIEKFKREDREEEDDYRPIKRRHPLPAKPLINEPDMSFMNDDKEDSNVNNEVNNNSQNQSVNNEAEIKEEKEKKNMSSLRKMFPNLLIGEVNDDSLKVSHLGIAVKNDSGVYVSYDAANKQIVDVDCVSFDGDQMLFYMPIQITDIKVGDVVINNGKPYYITNTSPLEGISYAGGNKASIFPTTNIFNLNFITKVMSFIDFQTISNGNTQMMFMLPMLMSNNDNENNKSDIVEMMFMSTLFTQNTSNCGGTMDSNLFSNPFMMYAMMKSDGQGNNDMMKMMFLSQMMNQQAKSNTQQQPTNNFPMNQPE